MFESITEVISHFGHLYNDSKHPIDLLPSPGYSVSELEKFQAELNITLHSGYIHLLEKVNLDTITFRGNITFGNGSSYLSAILKENKSRESDPYLWIAISGFHTIKLDNHNGLIYACDNHDIDTGYIELVANSFEEFILLCASITIIQWPTWENRDKAMEDCNQFFVTRNIERGKLFWMKVIWNVG